MRSHGCFFVLPDGSSTETVQIVVPVTGRIDLKVTDAINLKAIEDYLKKQQSMLRCHLASNLAAQVEHVVELYRDKATEALVGAKQFRDDALTYFRSIVFLLETAVNDHVSHAEKNARLRGVIVVLECHIQRLRQEQFDFGTSCWRQHYDVFRYSETERLLHQQLRETKERCEELTRQLESLSHDAPIHQPQGQPQSHTPNLKLRNREDTD